MCGDARENAEEDSKRRLPYLEKSAKCACEKLHLRSSTKHAESVVRSRWRRGRKGKTLKTCEKENLGKHLLSLGKAELLDLSGKSSGRKRSKYVKKEREKGTCNHELYDGGIN